MTEFDYQRNLISTVVHELKTPIAAARGFIELVQQVGPLNPTQTRYTERAMGALQRMELLIASLLEMARLDSDMAITLVVCDLKVLIADAVEMLQAITHKRRIQVEVNIEENARYVMGDLGLLSQVVSNLISNAVKYNRDGGRVAVNAQLVAGSVRVEIHDTGLGISPDDLEHVFEPFMRAKTGERIEGSGLGLWIAETVVRKHGGRIWAESVLGDGSVFSFTLPAIGSLNDLVSSEKPDGVEDKKQDSIDQKSDL
jgi:signal transduction histidine kinase